MYQCKECGEDLRNIETQNSNHITLVCINPDCEIRAKVQSHEQRSDH